MQAVLLNLRPPQFAAGLFVAGLVMLALGLPIPATGSETADIGPTAQTAIPVVEPGGGPVSGDALHRSQNPVTGPAARATGPTTGPSGLIPAATRIHPARPVGTTVAAVNLSPSPHRVLFCVWRL